MKNLYLLLVLGLGLSSSVIAQAPSIAVIDFQEVFENYSELRRLDNDLRKELETFRNQQAEKITALQSKNQEFESMRQKAATLETDNEERKALTEEASALFTLVKEGEQKFQNEQKAFNEMIQGKANRLRRDIVDHIQAFVQEMAKERGWDLVLDASAIGGNGLKIVQHHDAAMDFTDEVIRGLNIQAAERAQAGETVIPSEEPAATPAVNPGE
jgi:Skp family chaperone for outer membrane proteins